MRSRKIKRRFALILFTACAAALWFGYHNIVSRHVARTMKDAVALAKSNLLTELSDEFSRLKVAVTVISGSVYVQEFLEETDTDAYYEKAGAVAEIIRKAVYSAMNGDCIYTVSANGRFFRFTGGVSSDALEGIVEDVTGDSIVYSVAEFGGAGWFCLSSPVFSRGSRTSAPVGHIIMLSNLTAARRAITWLETMTDIDSAIIVDGKILFSSNPELDGKDAGELDRLYGSVSTERVEGSNMVVAAAITRDAMDLGGRLSLVAFLIVLAVFLAAFAFLYKLLSAKMLSPMLEDTDNMRMGLLKTQIDAHFVVNTITCIEGLAEQGKNEKAAAAARNLAYMLKARHRPDDEINIFEQMEDVERYIEIMNIRSDGKFGVEMDVSDELFHCRMPARILQPIVENALTHGLGNKERDCRLTITGKLENGGAGSPGATLFEVSDNGKGLETAAIRALQDTLDTADERDGESGLTGVALLNIQRRIRARYGKPHGLTVNGEPGRGLTVTIRLPVITDGNGK